MQCAVCRAEYSNSLDACPRCPRTHDAPATQKSAHAREKRAPATRAAARANASKTAPTPNTMSDNSTATATATAAAQTPAPSTLIEFPGTSRASRPQWRKDLSERVREIQQRRAREAAENEMNFAPQQQPLPEPPQANHAPAPRHQDDDGDAPAPSLGLVPTPRNDAPPMNPLVVAALRRIERARQPLTAPNATSKSRTSSGGAATAAAVAYVAEEQYQTALEAAPVEMPPAPAPVLSVAATEATSANEISKTEAKNAQATEAPRPSSLVVVTTPPTAKTETTVEAQKVDTASKASETSPAVKTGARMVANPAQVELKVEAGHASAARAGAETKPRRVIPGVLDEFSLERREAQITDAANCVPVVERENDHAPRVSRFLAGVADLVLVSLCTLPFAAIIELTSGKWSDPRVLASMTGIVLLVMFLYFVVSTGLVGRTPAMWVFSLRAVDARSALVPTTGQSMRRTLLYMLSLATLGLGIIYALFDAEGRTVHDHLSGTIVVRE